MCAFYGAYKSDFIQPSQRNFIFDKMDRKRGRDDTSSSHLPTQIDVNFSLQKQCLVEAKKKESVVKVTLNNHELFSLAGALMTLRQPITLETLT